MKVLIAGDFCPMNRVAQLISNKKYDEIFGDIKQITALSDFSVVNFECPIVIGESKPIEKCGPSLKCAPDAVGAIKWAGFDCVTLANNHFLDYGAKGVNDTIETLQVYHLDYVGGGTNIGDASNVLYKNIQGKSLAIINCCEHEFSIATESTPGANPLSITKQYYAIKEAKSQADYLIVIVHGGSEMYQLPSPRMKECYRFFVDAGADVVVNHHQHCFSGYEVYNGCPIFYGLGNFCFDWSGKRNSIWNIGYMVSITFDDDISFSLVPYSQGDDAPGVAVLKNTDSFLDDIEKLNWIIRDERLLRDYYNNYLIQESRKYIFCFEPFYNRLTRKLFDKGLIPSFIKKRRPALLNFIGNESHYDKVLMTIKETRK